MKQYAFPTREEVTNIKKFVIRKKSKNNKELKASARTWVRTAWENKMDYEVSWFGIPIMQNPYDIVLMQELIFDLKPDLIIETGVAHGGSLIYYASLLELLGKGKVIGIDVDIRDHNRKLLEKHPFIKRVELIEGDSADKKIVDTIKKEIKKTDTVLVILDSDHRKKHVYDELNAYKDIVSKDSYIFVFDTFVPYLTGLKNQKPYFKDNSAMDALKLFLKENSAEFKIDKAYNKFFVSSCPNGFIKRIK